MKLLYITNAINGSGGLERVLATKASYFAEVCNYEVHILVLNQGDKEPFFTFSKQINFHNINIGGHPIAYIQAYISGIKKVVSFVNPDLILVCDDGLKAFFLPTILRKLNKAIVYERHVSKLIELPHRATILQKLVAKCKWALMERLGRNFQAFVVLTEGNKEEWQTLDNIVVIPNPLPSIPDVKSSLNSKRIITVGKVSFQKGQDMMVQIWKRIAQEHPDWEWHNYGKLNNDFVDTHTLPERLFFHPPVQDINKEYFHSSIFALTSRFEGFGMVLIEAMANGVPCISFNCNYGPGDLIEDGVNGFLVENGNIDFFVIKTLVLMNDVNFRIEMGENAFEAVKCYQVETIVQQWNHLFNRLIDLKR